MKRKEVIDFTQWLDKRLKDADFKKAYEQADPDPFINVALQIILLREKNRLTQKGLARKVKTSQQAIARMESLRYRGYTLESINRIAKAFNKKLSIRFV